MAQQSDPNPTDAASQQPQQHVVPIQPSERASSSEVAKTRRFDSIANQLSAGPRGLPRETAQGITDIARRMVEDRTIMDRLRNICKDVVVDQSPQRVVDQIPNKVEELASPISSPTADTKPQQQEQRHHFEQGHFPKPDSSNSTSSFVRVASPEPHSPKQMPSKHQHQRQPPHHNISSQQEISSLLTDDEFFEIFASDPFVRIPENETPSRCADVSAAATAAPTEDHEPLTEDRLHRAAAMIDETSDGKHPLPDTATILVATAPPTQPPTNPPTNPPRTEPGDLAEGLEEEEEEDLGLASLPADDDATTPSPPRRAAETPPLTQEEQDEVAVHRDWPSLPSLPLAPTTALGDEGLNIMTDDAESATKKTSSTSPMMSTVVRSLWTTIWGGFGGAPEDEGDGGISSNARSPNQTNDGEEEDADEERPPQGPLMTPRRPMRRPEQDEDEQPYEYDAFGKRRAKRRPHHHHSRQASRDDGCFGDMGLGRGITAALHQHHAVDDHEEEYRFYHRQHPAEESSSSTSLPPSSSSLHHHQHTAVADPGHRGAGTAQLDEQHQPNFIHDERFYLAAAMLINSSLVYAMIASSGGSSPSPQGSPPRAVVVQKVLERVVEAVQAAFLR